MYLLRILPILVLFSTIAFSQSSYEKIAYYHYFDCENLLVDSSDNIYLAGQDNNGKILITKTDAAGNFIWSREIGDSWRLQYVGDMMLMNQDKIILLGASYGGASSNFRQLLIIEINTNGQIGFIQTLGDSISGGVYTPFKVLQISPTQFGIFANLQGASGISNGSVYGLFDINGNLVYSKAENGIIVKDALLLQNNSFLLLDLYNQGIMRYDSSFSNGTFETYTTLSTGGISENKKLVKSKYGEIYLLAESFGTPVIGHINSNFILDTAYIINASGMLDLGILDMKQLSSGHWIALGWYGISNSTTCQFMLMELDENFFPVNSVLTADTFYLDPFLNYDIGLTSDERAYFSTTKLNMMPIGTDAHFYSTSLPLTLGCNGIPLNTSLTLDSFEYMFSTPLSSIQHNTLVTSSNIPHINVTIPLFDCSATGVKESSEPGDILFYPNPATNSITFLSEGKYLIYDRLGKRRANGLVSCNQKINLSGLNPGVYFIQIFTNNNNFISKLLVTEP